MSLVTAIVSRVRYGGGEAYEDLSTPPLLSGSELEVLLQYPEPIGSVAVSNGGRIFFTVHPGSKPSGNKLLEWVTGAAVPYPSGSEQPDLFDSVLGLTIDSQQRLWTIDHGQHGFGEARLLAFDLRTDKLVHDFIFKSDIAPAGSFLNALRVSTDGQHVIIADASIWRQSPALIVYEIGNRHARRILESHESVVAENYLIRNPIRDLSYFGGLFALKAGINSIAIDAQNQWLYYAALNHGGLYRIRMQHVIDAALRPGELNQFVERFSNKPLSDGLTTDAFGALYVSDVEHNSISVIGTDRQARTLIRTSHLRWPTSLFSGPGGYLYVADSAFPELLLQTREHIKGKGPFTIFRVHVHHPLSINN